MKRALSLSILALTLATMLCPAALAAEPMGAGASAQVCYPTSITRSEDGTELKKIYDLATKTGCPVIGIYDSNGVKLDEGFELLYERVREELQGKKEQYAAWIAETRKLITSVMDKSVSIQAQENRNRMAVERAFYRERQNIGKGKRSMSVAMDYYRNMSNSHVVDPQYMDQKK